MRRIDYYNRQNLHVRPVQIVLDNNKRLITLTVITISGDH
jgi:hypothetical protein